MSRRSRGMLRDLTIFVAAMAVLAVVSLTEALLRSWGVLVLAALVGAVAFSAGRRTGRRDGRAKRAVLGTEVERLARVIADLESATGRPIEAVANSYRHIQQRTYGRQL